MKKILFFATCCSVALNLFAQRATDEQPYGLREGVRVQPQEKIVLKAPDISLIMKEDSITDQHPGPLRYAYPVRVSYTTENSGEWYQMDDGGRLWRLKVNIPGALATVTYYDSFWLPEGGKFFVYSEETLQSIGAIVSEFIEGSREKPIAFATALIYGENVVYEYYQPDSAKEPPIIHISNINYGYRYVNNPYSNETRNFGDALTCNININCTQGSNWQDEKRAVARVSIPYLKDGQIKGSGWCSCALVNNTGNDYTPYVLTADHCFIFYDHEKDKYERIFDADGLVGYNQDQRFMFYWHYEHPDCNNSSTEPTWRTTSGAWVVANNTDSDFGLLRLMVDPRNIPIIFPYYLGWDRTGNAVTSGVGIHHPAGDVKKISLTNQIQNYSNQLYWSNGSTTPASTHWSVNFYAGTTEGGSSGSPLINNNKKVIGQLHGGATGCAPITKYYGKFDVSWTGNNSNNNKRMLSPWLHPYNTTAPTTLNGIGVAAPYIAGPSILELGSSATFYVNNPPSQGYTWDKSSHFTGSGPTFTATSTGTGWIRILVGIHEVARYSINIILPKILGPNDICRTGSYSLNNNASAAWSVSSGFSCYPANGFGTTVTGSSGILHGTLSATLHGETESIPIHSCHPITGPDNLCYGNPQTYTFDYTNYGYVTSWQVQPPQLFTIISSNSTSAFISSSAYNGQIGAIIAVGNNVGFTKIIYATCSKGGSNDPGSYVTIYPNPTNGLLYIEIDADAAQAMLPAKVSKLTFDVRLYDGQGNLQRQQKSQGETVEFDVTNLPNGFYYVHVYDGVNSTPVMFQVVVEH